MLAWLITDINGISHANLILRIRHVCRWRSVDKVCHVCMGRGGRLGGDSTLQGVYFTLWGIWQQLTDRQRDRETDRKRGRDTERKTEAKALGISLALV